MSIKVSIQNPSGLPPWALTELLLIASRFHCHVSIRDGEIMIDGKSLIEVISMTRSRLPRVEVQLRGEDEEEALDCIRDSRVGQYIAHLHVKAG